MAVGTTATTTVVAGTGTGTIDPFLWAYTADFAKTFAMPQQWVELGVEALRLIELVAPLWRR